MKLQPGLYSLTLAEAPAPVLIWAIPRAKILPRKGGPTWDLDASETDAATLRFRWADVVEGLTRWVGAYQPPVIVDHGRTESGIPVAHGLATGIYEVPAELAESLGVPQSGDALYIRVEPSAELAALLADGLVPYASPNLQANYTDSEGEHWPITVKELSLTLDPRQKRRQLPIAKTAAITAALLSEDGMPEEIEVKTETPEGGDALTALAEAVRMLAERLDKIEANLAEPVAEDVAGEVEATLSEPVEVAALRKRVVELETEAKRAKSTAAVDALLSEREIGSDAKPHLVALHMANPVAADAILRAAPKRGTTLKRAPVVGAPTSAPLSDMSKEELAAHLVQTGQAKSLSDAWNSLHQ